MKRPGLSVFRALPKILSITAFFSLPVVIVGIPSMTKAAGAPANICGDGLCESGEGSASCPEDCGTCGDSNCSACETSSSCPQDCGAVCGDLDCNAEETPSSCSIDCKSVCGDLKCDPDETNCILDCGLTGEWGCFATSCQTSGECNDNNACTDDSCESQVCIHTPIADQDSDGACDAQDNCPEKLNPGQEDKDGDGIGDACDPVDNSSGGGDGNGNGGGGCSLTVRAAFDGFSSSD